MGGSGTIIPARMSLSVRPGPSKIECAFSYNGQELSRRPASLPNQELLEAYRSDINSAAAGFSVTGSSVRLMKRELRKIIPRPVAAFVRDAVVQGPEASTLALEIMLNDPEILDPYPWELLSDRGLLVDRKIAVTVWRSVPAPKFSRLPSSSVFLVGSASFDTTSTDAAGEIAVLAQILKNCTGIHPFGRPRITFAGFLDLLKALGPSVIHIITHGNINGFQFQEEPEASRSHADIPPQELGAYLAESSTANLVLLNACHSASSWDDRASMARPSMARRIATTSSTTTIGMSTEIPNIVGFEFSKIFFQALVSGDSLIEAFGAAVHAIRQQKKFSTLWSTPVMNAPPDSNVILFPADPMGRMRLRFQELGRQLRQLDLETGALTGYAIPQAPDGPPSMGALKIRLAYIRDLLDELEVSTLKGPEHLRARLLLTQVKNHAGQALAQLQTMLGNLQDSHRSREQRGQRARSIRLALDEQIRAFTQLEREFSDTR